jgi:hypothetical protein
MADDQVTAALALLQREGKKTGDFIYPEGGFAQNLPLLEVTNRSSRALETPIPPFGAT